MAIFVDIVFTCQQNIQQCKISDSVTWNIGLDAWTSNSNRSIFWVFFCFCQTTLQSLKVSINGTLLAKNRWFFFSATDWYESKIYNPTIALRLNEIVCVIVSQSPLLGNHAKAVKQPAGEKNITSKNCVAKAFCICIWNYLILLPSMHSVSQYQLQTDRNMTRCLAGIQKGQKFLFFLFSPY